MLSQRNLLLATLLAAAAVLLGCESQGDRKIKLARTSSGDANGTETTTSVLQVPPNEQHTVAILYFENETGDESLDWLRRGLTDMLVADLSQSPYLKVITTKRLGEIASRLGKSPEDLTDPRVATRVANAGNAETLLTGRFGRSGDSLRIQVDLRDVDTGQVLRRETVWGDGLERIFLMVDELSQRLRSNLRGDLQAAKSHRLRLADMTKSLDAFRCYSEGLENLDKLIFVVADSCFRQAVMYDSTFAVAYLHLAHARFGMGLREEGMKALKQARRFADKLSDADRIKLRLAEAEGKGDVRELLAAVENLSQYAPYDVDIRMQLASLLLHQFGDYDRALEEYETIRELDPTRKLVYNQLAYLYAYRGDFTTALNYLDTYERLAPNEPNPYDSRGEILMMAGRLKEATVALKTALQKWPAFYQSAMRLTEIYAELGNLSEALKYSRIWISNAPSPALEASAYSRQAALLWRFGRIAAAEKALRAAQKVAPDATYPVIIGGEMYKAIGDTVAAQRLYDAYFARHETGSRSAEEDRASGAGLLWVGLQLDRPGPEVIRLAERLVRQEKRALFREQYALYLNVLYLRAGMVQRAQEAIGEPSAEFYSVLNRMAMARRSKVWKYMAELIQREPKQDQPDYTFCNSMLKAARQAGRKDLEVIARFFLAQYHAKYGHRNKLAQEYQALGSPLEDDWLVIGPFENRSGFDRQFPPENSIDLEATYPGLGGEVSWLRAADGMYDGYVDLKAVLKRSSWAVAYAAVVIHSPTERTVQIRMAADESCKLWLNDDLVWQVYRQHEGTLDRDIVTVMLHPGDNKLLLKITNSTGDWGFFLRITDENGDGITDLAFHPPADAASRFAQREARISIE